MSSVRLLLVLPSLIFLSFPHVSHGRRGALTGSSWFDYHKCLDTAWSNAQCPFTGTSYRIAFRHMTNDRSNDTSFYKFISVNIFRHVCFSSPLQIVLYNLLNMQTGELLKIPDYNINEMYNLPTQWGHGDFLHNGGGIKFPRLSLRYAADAAHELHSDIAAPKFTCGECVNIVVITSLWFNIYADWTYRSLGPLYFNKARLDKIPNKLFVINTAGFKLPPYIRFHLKALGTPFDVITLEELGSDRNAGYRCFETVHLIHLFSYGWYHNISTYDAMQHVVRHYRAAHPSSSTSTFSLASIFAGAQPAFPVPPGATARDLGELRVVISSRSSPHTRSLLNVQEAMDWCASLGDRYAEHGWKRVTCSQHAFGLDLLQDLQVMARSNALVCIHGSEVANAGYMPPGSAFFEVLPHEFVHWHREYHFKAFNIDTKVFPFILRTVSKGHHEPGFFEKNKMGIPFLWPRDRHTKINLTALTTLVDRYAAVQTREDYVRLRDANQIEVEG